jgi:protein phosphatase 2C family protein 2/3
MELAIRNGCDAAEQKFMERNKATIKDRSGSCAILLLLTEYKVWVANVGDSRAVLASDQGVQQLSRDHKPNDPMEAQRIQKAGGSVY